MKLLRSIFGRTKTRKSKSVDSFPRLENTQNIKGGYKVIPRKRYGGPVIIVEDTHFRPTKCGF